MPKSKGINEKKAAGLERKAANKAAKEAAATKERETLEAAEWKKGSNTRGAERAAQQAQKADEQARKRAEKAALLAEEEASMKGKSASASQARKAAAAVGGAGKKKKKKDGLSLLEESLVGDAEKKAKAAKRAERIKKEKEERLRMERERQNAESNKNQDPLMANTDAMIGNSLNHTNNGTLNASLEKGDVDASGIDSALSSMALGGAGAGGGEDSHPEKRMKALHKAFEEKMMPQMKEEYPGLKRRQYIEKIFALWKKSPENPMNWQKDS